MDGETLLYLEEVEMFKRLQLKRGGRLMKGNSLKKVLHFCLPLLLLTALLLSSSIKRTLTNSAFVTFLTCEVWDMDTKNEFQIQVNGRLVYVCPTNASNNDIWVKLSFDITNYVIQGDNFLKFFNPTTAYCRLRNVQVKYCDVAVLKDTTSIPLQLSEKTYCFNLAVEISFIVFSDIHVGRGIGSDGLNATGRLEKLLSSANSFGVPMFCLGDISNGWSENNTQQELMYDKYLQITAKYRDRMEELRGNHDANANLWVKKFGPLNTVVRYQEILFVLIDFVGKDCAEWQQYGVSYNKTTYTFLNNVLNSKDYKETTLRFLLLHFSFYGFFDAEQKYAVPSPIANYLQYFTLTMHGHEGGPEKVYRWCGYTVVKTSHLADGKINTDTYLKVTFNRLTKTLSITSVNFMTNTSYILWQTVIN